MVRNTQFYYSSAWLFIFSSFYMCFFSLHFNFVRFIFDKTQYTISNNATAIQIYTNKLNNKSKYTHTHKHRLASERTFPFVHLSISEYHCHRPAIFNVLRQGRFDAVEIHFLNLHRIEITQRTWKTEKKMKQCNINQTICSTRGKKPTTTQKTPYTKCRREKKEQHLKNKGEKSKL